MTVDEIDELADRCNVSRGRALIWEKEGSKSCAICAEPILMAAYGQPTHVDFRVKSQGGKSEELRYHLEAA